MKYTPTELEPENIVMMDTKKTIHLKASDFYGNYTEEELELIKNESYNLDNITYLTDNDTKYNAIYENRIGPNGKHEFTYAEDEFIKKNYKHLSDNVIGMALRLPSHIIGWRRYILGCVKVKTLKNVTLVVWNNRGTYEEDCKKYNLTKERSYG